MNVSRRRLLTVLAGGAVASAAARFRLGFRPARRDDRTVWLSLVRDCRSSRAVGRAYLASLPAVPDSSDLRRRLLPSDPQRAASVVSDVERLRQHIGRQVRDDFGSGRTVQVRGWVLAETEARVCALIAML